MADRGKVIKALEIHLSTNDSVECDVCTYENDGWCVTRMMTDALVLLKEQEPVKPLAQADDTFECSCGAIVGWDELDASGIVKTQLNYCPFCGRAVEWE